MTATEDSVEANSLVAVGTTREPKLRAVRRVLGELRERFPEYLPGELRVEPRSVPSGVAATPMTAEETMRGARQRALAVRESLRGEGLTPSLAIGLEGGLAVESGAPFLQSWAYVTDGTTGRFGSSGSIPLPEELAEAVLVRGEDLGPAADRYFHRREVAANEGTFGVLTRMMVSREDAFARALLHALAPFYNKLAYGGPVAEAPEAPEK
jgi:inosine/xanthosine triphosphatase